MYSELACDSVTSPCAPSSPEQVRLEQIFPVEAALLRPSAARWLKLLSLRPPVSVTRPTLMTLGVGVAPVPAPLPHAARTTASVRATPRLNKRTGGFLIRHPLQW